MNAQFWINVLAIVLSPILAVLITIWLTRRNEKRKEKMETFKQLMISRVTASTEEFVKIVNSIDVIFADSKPVRQAWKELFDEYTNPNYDLDRVKYRHTKLIEAVARDLGYKNKIEWNEIIENVYIPHWLVETWAQNNVLKDSQKNFAKVMETAVKNLPEQTDKKLKNKIKRK